MLDIVPLLVWRSSHMHDGKSWNYSHNVPRVGDLFLKKKIIYSLPLIPVLLHSVLPVSNLHWIILLIFYRFYDNFVAKQDINYISLDAIHLT